MSILKDVEDTDAGSAKETGAKFILCEIIIIEQAVRFSKGAKSRELTKIGEAIQHPYKTPRPSE